MFTPEMIRTRVKQQPFVPLRFKTSSGDFYDVLHPDMVLIGVRDIIVGMPRKGKEWLAENYARISLLHIVGMEDLPQPVPAEKNGAS